MKEQTPIEEILKRDSEILDVLKKKGFVKSDLDGNHLTIRTVTSLIDFVIELQAQHEAELKAKDDKIHFLTEMIHNGLGWEDLEDDSKPMDS